MTTPEEIRNKALRRYPEYLASIVQGTSFFPLVIPANKKAAVHFAVRHKELDVLISQSKDRLGYGFSITYQTVQTRQHGIQDTITGIVFTSEPDYLRYLDKEQEAVHFNQAVALLLQWQPTLAVWLLKNTPLIVPYLSQWTAICAVTDYILQHDVSHHYLRSLPVPVHTKFIERHFGVIYSLLKYLQPEQFVPGQSSPEAAFGLLRKPFLFTLRWLDNIGAGRHSSGMEVFATTVDYLKSVQWSVQRIIFVENETNLYLLPALPGTLALFSSGNALHLLKEIPLLSQSALLYWGDLDERGFGMLNDMRTYYPHVQSLLMDEQVVVFHKNELIIQPIYKRTDLPNLTPEEQAAFQFLAKHSGRIEQEQLNHQYMHEHLWGLLSIRL